ncbi:hypothetical protein H8K90_16560 [Winogradskyella echinorum]|uniref:Uncharacterized protein n=1 Tax=Winogradskyella echinorum TaxID=538189 RepID=A0ABR6Y5M9_9FLAO|nr:hypothetical protein [Winogradskyella echinorum]MBC3848009.1 hypothetical protein [Winogradskyella echinorum]MBC5752357.1 hypothetical protein [Winogradskyella echinorum]
MTGTFELKKQLNSIGLFCIIELEILKSKNKGISVNYNINDIEDFKIAIEYGIHLAFENLLLKGIKKNYHISVTKFKWITIDTTLSCVSYSSCRAVFNAFGFDSKISNPKINDIGEFIF